MINTYSSLSLLFRLIFVSCCLIFVSGCYQAQGITIDISDNETHDQSDSDEEVEATDFSDSENDGLDTESGIIETDSDGATDDTGDTSDVIDTEIGCPWEIAPNCDATTLDHAKLQLPVLLNSSQFGESAFFTQLEPFALSGERTEGEARILFIYFAQRGNGRAPWEYCEGGNAEMALAKDSALHIRGIAHVQRSSNLYNYAQVAILLCDDKKCSLWGAQNQVGATTEFIQLVGDDLPLALEGLWADSNREYICAFGDGRYCYNVNTLSWMQFPIETASSVRQMVNAPNLELGQFQWWWLFMHEQFIQVHIPENSDAPFEAFSTRDYPEIQLTGEVFTSVISDETTFMAGTSVGNLFVLNADDSIKKTECPLSDDGIAHLIYRPSYGFQNTKAVIWGITEKGAVFQSPDVISMFPKFCFSGQVIDKVIDTNVASCGASDNILVLSEQQLLGHNNCAITKIEKVDD